MRHKTTGEKFLAGGLGAALAVLGTTACGSTSEPPRPVRTPEGTSSASASLPNARLVDIANLIRQQYIAAPENDRDAGDHPPDSAAVTIRTAGQCTLRLIMQSARTIEIKRQEVPDPLAVEAARAEVRCPNKAEIELSADALLSGWLGTHWRRGADQVDVDGTNNTIYFGKTGEHASSRPIQDGIQAAAAQDNILDQLAAAASTPPGGALPAFPSPID